MTAQVNADIVCRQTWKKSIAERSQVIIVTIIYWSKTFCELPTSINIDIFQHKLMEVMLVRKRKPGDQSCPYKVKLSLKFKIKFL